MIRGLQIEFDKNFLPPLDLAVCAAELMNRYEMAAEEVADLVGCFQINVLLYCPEVQHLNSYHGKTGTPYTPLSKRMCKTNYTIYNIHHNFYSSK